MQLNSLTLNSNTTSPGSKCFLSIYDHNLVVINRQIFVFGKTFSNFSIQTPLHKINIETLEAEAVYTINAPIFDRFIMFGFERRIYFFGKKLDSQNNQLYQFDGCKFIRLEQKGSLPNLTWSYSYTMLSHQYVLLFLSLCENQLQNKWYIFDIKTREWKQGVSDVCIPICERSSILWKNGRGYLLLQNAYQKHNKAQKRNVLYEIKIKELSKFIIKCNQIPVNEEIGRQNIMFREIFSISDKYLMILGNYRQNKLKDIEKQFKIHDSNHQIVYKFDLELFQWSDQYQIINIKGSYHKIISQDSVLYFIGGIYQNKVLDVIQFQDFKSFPNKNFPYEQSLCYYCESAFTYSQATIYQPIIETEYESFSHKTKIENKLMKKLSQSIANQIQAFGIICQFMLFTAASEIKISLCEDIRLPPFAKSLKSRIDANKGQVLEIRGKSLNYIKKQYLSDLFQNRQKFHHQYKHSSGENMADYKSSAFSYQDFYTQFMRLKAACYKLGVGFLYVTLTQKKQVFVGYCSYSQTNMPESHYDSIAQYYYLVRYNSVKLRNQYSSILNRQIIYENVKLYFSRPKDYQNSIFNGQMNSKFCYSSLYIVEVATLEKQYNIEPERNCYYEDIRIKSISKNNTANVSNSLRNYLKHFFLPERDKEQTKVYVENQQVRVANIYSKFSALVKTKQLKLIYKTQQPIQKTQHSKSQIIRSQMDQTRFSENQPESFNDKKLQFIQKCVLYQNSRKKKAKLSTLDDLYSSKIFLYRKKRLVKTLNSRKQYLCGVIEVSSSIELMLNGAQMSCKKEEKKLLIWIDEIQSSLSCEFLENIEEI